MYTAGKTTALLAGTVPIPLDAAMRQLARDRNQKISYHVTCAVRMYLRSLGIEPEEPAAPEPATVPAPAPARRPRLAPGKPLAEVVRSD